MKTITPTVTAPTEFEMFLREHFGIVVDLSSNLSMAVIGMAILMLPFFFAGLPGARNGK